jgi:MFS family permease
MKKNASSSYSAIRQGRWLHVIPVAFVMFTIAYIDRTNISMALPSMSRDLHMTSTQAGGAAGVFFWGYLFLQIPGGYLAEHWSAKRVVSVLLVAWGICSAACGLVQSARQLYVIRFLLGVAEGGVWPATLVLFASWFPRKERARANGYWMLCQPVALIFSAPLSGWILRHWSWRALLVWEGVLPFAWLLIWWRFMDDHPHQARWIDRAEREYLESTLRQEASELAPAVPTTGYRTLLSARVWLLTLIYFLANCSHYGYLFWLPSLLKNVSQSTSDVTIGFVFAIPYLLAGVGMVMNSRHSDLRMERRWHVAVPYAVAGVFLLLAILLRESALVVSLALLCVAGMGTYGALGPFWALITETFGRGRSGLAMGLINALGALGGYFGPVAVGYLTARTGSFLFSFGALALGLLISSLLTLLLPPASTGTKGSQNQHREENGLLRAA